MTRIHDLHAVLGLEPDDARPDVFHALTLARTAPNIYGGQYLGQATAAASRTIDGDRAPHALHAFFLRSGDLARPVRYEVERLQDGRSFARRRVQAFQGDAVLFSTIISFQEDYPGPSHHERMPENVPDPEDLEPAPSRPSMVTGLEASFDVREVPGLLDEGVARRAIWMRALGDLPDDERFHRAALAFASDHGLLLPALVRHRIDWTIPGLRLTSLDHALWWHTRQRVDEWFLFVQESPQAADGRGLTAGRFYTRDGRLLASAAQEGLMRLPLDHPDVAGPAARSRPLS